MKAIAKAKYSPQLPKKREILTKLSNNLNYVNYTKCKGLFGNNFYNNEKIFSSVKRVEEWWGDGQKTVNENSPPHLL